MKILITNDDGIFSSGIYALWEVAKEFGSVYVVAPNSQKSATGHSITISKPLFIDKIKRKNGFEGIAVTGSPADCVKFGLKKILSNAPDLILSGINLGSNLGYNIIYSGTVAAAVEGAMQNIPSIAFSIDSFNPKSFDTSKSIIRQIINLAIENRITKKFKYLFLTLIFFNLTGKFLMLSVARAVQSMSKGHKVQFGDFGLHCFAPNSMRA